MKTGLLVIGHGSRSVEAQETFNKVIELVKKRSNDQFDEIIGAHMELCQPDIHSQIKKLVNKNIKRVLMVPYFLYRGIHIQEDIPKIIKSLQKKYPSVEFKFGRPIGEESLLADILIKRGLEL